MDGSRSRSRSRSRSARRSYPNLHNLSLAPLSSQLDASAPPSPERPDRIHTTSYIAQKSAPATPGILSLSQSRSNSRNGRRTPKPHAYAYDAYFVNPHVPVRDQGDVPKAKSTTALLPGVSFADEQPSSHARHHARKATAPLPLRPAAQRNHTSEPTNEWFHRAGLAIAGETRDSKGQGWLVRRESSTSLVHQTDDYEDHPSHRPRHMALLSGEHLQEGELAAFAPHHSRPSTRPSTRPQSRVVSRVPSARTSRRGSRVGSRADLAMTSGLRTPGARPSLELDDAMFDDSPVEPDFVEADEDGEGDEEEVARLARERGFGLGGWMDRLMGWTLFSVDEDGEESSGEEEEEEEDRTIRPENMTKEELKLRREVEAKRRKLERETIIAASAVQTSNSTTRLADGESTEPKPPPAEESSGWADAAWLVSVAAKVLL